MATQRAERGGARGPYAKSSAKRRAIVDAAHEVFSQRGYRAASLKNITDHAGISETSLFHYFGTKQDLLVAVLDHRDHLGIRARPDADGCVDLYTELRQQAEWNEDVPGVIQLYSVLVSEATTEDHPGRQYFADRFTELRQRYAREFALLQEQGRLRPGSDPDMLAASLVALWDGIQVQWLHDPASVDVPATLKSFLDLAILPDPPA
ncbi:TetR/AcrR family transcriptional regulator [Arthrobacter castelli]|uniref:TetR/AcrR family transcriptional regulator n=1 Tax=Arthrobacter castelli TaxID=271431 RepID=UPI0003FCC755|nr:TetR/AcrR family transcriptional regulator [Arthrobacter castelli]